MTLHPTTQSPDPSPPDDGDVGSRSGEEALDEALFASTAPWAMQLVLRDERTERATHLAACEAAAVAVVRLLDDPRSVDGPWQRRVATWNGGPIRKVVRRARGAPFEATGALEGIEVISRGAQVRAFLPQPVDLVPPALTKLQVSGTDLPEIGESAAPVTDGLTIALTPYARLTTGKAAAQSGHAAHLAWRTLPDGALRHWRATGFAVRVVLPDVAGWLVAAGRAQVSVADAGYTEVAPGTVTAVAWQEPDAG